MLPKFIGSFKSEKKKFFYQINTFLEDRLICYRYFYRFWVRPVCLISGASEIRTVPNLLQNRISKPKMQCYKFLERSITSWNIWHSFLEKDFFSEKISFCFMLLKTLQKILWVTFEQNCDLNLSGIIWPIWKHK